MTILQAIILGIVQGISEFLPISSSAHLVLVPELLGWQIPADQIFPFDVLVQLGTLVAVILYFWKDLLRMVKAFIGGVLSGKPFAEPDSRLAWLIIVATIPAGIIGITIKDTVEAAFASATISAIFLLVTAVILWLTEHFSRPQRSLAQITWWDAVWIGLAQALAIFPGISRSGSTISTGLLRGIRREEAGRFSFLMSIPIMLAAGLLGGKDLLEVNNLAAFLPVMAIGFITAGVVGYASIRWLMKLMQTHSFKPFAYYCAGFALVALVLLQF
ncbi:MAG: undecaprenyl-diphosphatase UppP [Anaerolineae bacterium]|nr:undecaprenyl-diphosphatase UppP [Anaerolineae bacterium]